MTDTTTIDSQYTQRTAEDNRNYIKWDSMNVEIPNNSYNFGGKARKYDADNVLSLLKDYQRWIDANNVLEAIYEEIEDGHAPYFLDVVLIKNLRDRHKKLKNLKDYHRIDGRIKRLELELKLQEI